MIVTSRRLISNVLPFGRLWYGVPGAIRNAVGYAKFRSRSHNAVIRVYHEAGNVIETHEHAGDFKADVAEYLAQRYGYPFPDRDLLSIEIAGKSSLTISAKPVGVGAAWQPLIFARERSSLSTHVATVNASLCVRMKN